MAKPQQIFLHLREGIAYVKDGFSWPAFFFGSLWAMAKRMWLPHVPLLLVADAGLWFLTGVAEARDNGGLVLLGLVATLLYAFARGRHGNRWLAASLRRRGYFRRYPAFDPGDDRRIRAFGLVPVAVRDFQEAMAFYVGVLGFVRAEDVGDAPGGQPWRAISRGNQKMLVVQSPLAQQLAAERARAGERQNIPLFDSDCRATCERLRAEGVKILQEPAYREAEDALVAVFADPCGNLWDLVQSRRQW